MKLNTSSKKFSTHFILHSFYDNFKTTLGANRLRIAPLFPTYDSGWYSIVTTSCQLLLDFLVAGSYYTATTAGLQSEDGHASGRLARSTTPPPYHHITIVLSPPPYHDQHSALFFFFFSSRQLFLCNPRSRDDSQLWKKRGEAVLLLHKVFFFGTSKKV